MNAQQQKDYDAMVKDGVTPRLAEMLACQQPPGARTDREFMMAECNGSQFEDTPEIGDAYAAVAKAAGVSVKGKKYLSGLAKFPGDPEAWVSGMGDAQRIIEQNGWGSQGLINRPVTRVAEAEQTTLAADIVEAKVQQELATNASQAHAGDIEGVREKVIERHKPHWA